MHYLLPLLVVASSRRPTYTPRVISILGTGHESANIPLDDLDLRKSENFSMIKVAQQAATLNTLALGHLAAQPPNKKIVFIHNHPGIVKTEIFKNGWGEKPFDPQLIPDVFQTGMSPEMSGERSLYLITSSQFGGKGVPLSENFVGCGLTIAKTESGALFCVDDHIECVQQESVIGQLKSQNADVKIWEETMKVLAPYL